MLFRSICYGLPGVGKTLSSQHYAKWSYVNKQISYKGADQIGINADERILNCKTIFYTAPSIKASQMIGDIRLLGGRLGMVKSVYKYLEEGEEEKYSTDWTEDNAH